MEKDRKGSYKDLYVVKQKCTVANVVINFDSCSTIKQYHELYSRPNCALLFDNVHICK